KRLGQTIIRSVIETAHLLLKGHAVGENQHMALHAAAAPLFQECEAILARQIEIEDHNIEVAAQGLVVSLLAVARDLDDEPFLFEAAPQQADEGLVSLGKQDPHENTAP